MHRIVWKASVGFLGILTAAYLLFWLPFCWLGIGLLTAPALPTYVDIAWDIFMVAAPGGLISALWWLTYKTYPLLS